MKTALVLGAGGFIGSHMVKRLKKDGYWVRGVDLKYPDFSVSEADEFVTRDLRDPDAMRRVIRYGGQSGNFYSQIVDKFLEPFDEIYQFAADMGGAGYIFTGENDADIMHNSASINLNLLDQQLQWNQDKESNKTKIFYSSSACMYPEHNQLDPDNPNCEESSAYPADPDSEYGWEKLFSERLYFAFNRNYNLDVRVARFHNIFGPQGTWTGGKEKAPAAMIRKVCEANDGDEIEVWGNGKQTRSFLHVSECVEAVLKMMNSNFKGPVNIGSEEMISINGLAQMAIDISGKSIKINNLDGDNFIKKYGFKCPLGVKGRNSDNKLYKSKIGWVVSEPLIKGMKNTFDWILQEVNSKA